MREPLRATIAGRAEERIRSGDWSPGDRLPPERELCRQLDVSRATLRQALAELEQRGLVTRHQGRGTFVARPRVQQDLARFFSLGEALRARGLALASRVLAVGIVEAGRSLAGELGVLPGDPLVRLQRLRSVEAEPLTLEDTHLPAAPFPGLEERDFARRSLYDVLAEDYGCVVASAVESLEPVILTPGEASLLGVPRNAPALLVRRVTTDRAGRRVEHAQALLRGDRARLLLRRSVGEVGGPAPSAEAPAGGLAAGFELVGVG
jgi:GntR family transcriptional regulator